MNILLIAFLFDIVFAVLAKEVTVENSIRVDIGEDAQCCANKIENRYYKKEKEHLPETMESSTVCFKSCLARNNPGPQRCFGFMYFKKTKECYLVLDKKNIDCSKNSDDLKKDKDYDFYCNLYCSNSTDDQIPPDQCSPASVVSEPVAIFFGGRDAETDNLDTIEFYYPQHPAKNKIINLHLDVDSRNKFAAVLTGKKPLVIYGGGHGSKGVSGTTMIFSPYPTPNQKPGSTLIKGRTTAGYAVIENFGLLVCGGLHEYKYGADGLDIFNTIMNSCEHYDQAKKEFVSAVALPFKLYSLAMVSYKGKAYVFGGIDENKRYVRKVLNFDPQSPQKKWKIITSMPYERHWHRAAAIGDAIYICGGWTTEVDMGTVYLCDAYNPDTNIWRKIEGPKNAYRHSHTMLVIDRKVYLFGGYAKYDPYGPGLDIVLSYDPETNKWKNETKLKGNRANAAGVVVQLPTPE